MKILTWFYSILFWQIIWKLMINFEFISDWTDFGCLCVDFFFFLKDLCMKTYESVLVRIKFTWCHTRYSNFSGLVYHWSQSRMFITETTVHSGKQKNEIACFSPCLSPGRVSGGDPQGARRELTLSWTRHGVNYMQESRGVEKKEKGAWLFRSSLGLRGDEVGLAES